MTLLEQFLTLGVINLGLMAVAGAVLGYTALLDSEKSILKGPHRVLAGILIFGIIAIIGTQSSVSLGAAYTFRDGGVISGGLFFGGPVGIGAAILAVAHRATLGGVTMMPCLVATMMVGIISEYLYHRHRDKITVLTATLAALGMEMLHALIVILWLPDGEGMEIIFHTPAGWFIIMSTMSVLVFSLCYTTMKRRRV